jgi:hypothetical protein
VVALLLAGCGGRTDAGGGGTEGSTDDQKTSGAEQPKDDPDTGSSAPGDTPLGECVLGALARPAMGDPCPWLAEGRCYESREMACNCICPRSKDSQCLSGFEGGPNSRVEVLCQ